MMLFSLCVVTIFGFVAAEPTRCCFDKQFSSILGEIGGTVKDNVPTNFQLSMAMGFDYYRGRDGTLGTYPLPDGTSFQVKTINDFNRKIIYTKTINGSCTAKAMRPGAVQFGPCLPDDATYVGNATFGYGSETITVNSWKFLDSASHITPKPESLVAFTENCVPFAQTVSGNLADDGALTQVTMFYTAYHPGLQDFHDLDIPDDCPLDAQGGPAVGR